MTEKEIKEKLAKIPIVQEVRKICQNCKVRRVLIIEWVEDFFNEETGRSTEHLVHRCRFCSHEEIIQIRTRKRPDNVKVCSECGSIYKKHTNVKTSKKTKV